MRKSTNRILSLLLCVMMLVTMLPVSAFATESGGSQQFMDSGGTPPQSEGTPKHWLQQYQEAVLAQLSAENARHVRPNIYPRLQIDLMGIGGRKPAHLC